MKYYCAECVLAVCALFLGFGISLAAEPPDQPNVIFVLADDLGWSELGCYGNGFNETPHLDALAKQGMRFTQAYAAAPVCSPYRAAFLTGQLPARTGIMDYLRPNSANALSTDHITPDKRQKLDGLSTVRTWKNPEQPQVVTRLAAKLQTWREGIDARIPSPPLLASTR